MPTCQILTFSPGDRDALRDLITVRRLMAGQDAAKLQQQGEAYRRALTNGTDTAEHYTPTALEILAMANFVAANQIREARVTRAREAAPATGSISSLFHRVVRRGSRNATAAQPRPPQPVVSPPAGPAAPASATPEKSAPAPPPSLTSTPPTPALPPEVIATTPSNPPGAVSREPDQDLVSHPGGPPAATPAGSQETGLQHASTPAAAAPTPPATGGTSPGNATKTSSGHSASGGGRLPLVPLYPNPKPRGDQ